MRAAIGLAGADARMRFAVDAADKAERPSADLTVLRSEVGAMLDIANDVRSFPAPRLEDAKNEWTSQSGLAP